MFYCRAYFNFNRSLTGGHVLKVYKEDNRVLDDFVVQTNEYFDVEPNERYKVVNKEVSDNVYLISSLKLRVIS